MSSYKSGAHFRPMRGFSLIEVMIAVVILATGLLALAALQGSLTRASAEAKVRGRVAAMLTARLEDLRLQSGGLAEGPTTTTSTTDPCDGDTTDWVDCTRAESNLGSLSVVQTVATWSGNGSFTQATTTDPDIAQFKRITLAATWEDATGGDHSLTTSTDASTLSLVTSLVQQPDDAQSGGSNPIVRQDSPATAGVIPVALGNGDSSASSNPKPELVGRNNNQTIVGTRFNVLTYTPETGNAARIQKRFENDVIRCTCQYGAGGSNLPQIYRTAQWPAIWTGERYDIYDPDSSAEAPGQVESSGPASGVEQSALCQECCRDHHDTDTTGVAKFDPERIRTNDESDGREKYNVNGSNELVLANTNNGVYVNSCRLIRVDGFWRTAADMYSRQFGLLETQAVSSVRAKSGLPTTAATDAYTQFIKDYVRGYRTTTATSGSAPAGAQGMFDEIGRGLNATTVPIAAVSANPPDYRYVHGRGLYIDYLEADARQRIVDVLADNGEDGLCPATGPNAVTDQSECILPYLPFTTINMTEIAKWTDAPDTNVLTINSGNLLATDPTQPSGGRTIGTAVGTATNVGSARNSNSGVAYTTAVVGGVDPEDVAGVSSDGQEFQVGGTVNAGPTFDVRVSGGGSNPFVFFTLGASTDVECTKPAGGDHRCVTASGTVLPQAGSIRVSNYWVETTANRSITAQCYEGGTLYTVTDTISVPLFRNYVVTAASIGGVGGTIENPATNDNRKTESTTISFTGITAGGLITVTLAEQTGSPTYATIAAGACTTNGGHNKINNPTWTKPWELP